MEQERILVFARHPTPGRSKTRLAAHVGAEAAARLARRFAEETLAAAATLGLPIEVCCSPDEALPEFKAWLGRGFAYAPQGQGALGERMCRALARAFAQGVERAILVGTDVPDLPPAFLAEALRSLVLRDAVLGPARDGGYWLVGMRRQGFEPGAFAGIDWGTAAVLGQSLAALKKAGKSVHLLPAWRDIDDLAGLQDYLRTHPEAAGLLEGPSDPK